MSSSQIESTWTPWLQARREIPPSHCPPLLELELLVHYRAGMQAQQPQISGPFYESPL